MSDTQARLYALAEGQAGHFTTAQAERAGVSRRFRGRRRGVVVHHAPLDPGERPVREDVPVTTVERTLLDVARSSDPSLVRTAVRDALERGLTTVDRLEDAATDHPRERHVLLGTGGAGA